MNYKCDRWIHKREAILKRDEYICKESSRYGKRIAATMVHHIYPAEQYPELAYENWNLISLSDSMHNTMHVRDSHELTDAGKRWQEKVRDSFNKWYMDKGISPPGSNY